jgi:hypothetical protein
MKKRFSARAVLCLALAAGLQVLVFFGTRLLLPGRALHDLSVPLDGRIPFVPAWITVYFSAYAVWAAGLLIILAAERARGIRVLFAYGLALLICGIVFVLYPCTMERPEIVGEGIFAEWMRFLYRADSPTNLFPSIHVLASWFCWHGMTGSRKIPFPVKALFFVFWILVSLSVLFVKQHVLADIPSAVVLAELCIFSAKCARPERFFRRLKKHLSEE